MLLSTKTYEKYIDKVVKYKLKYESCFTELIPTFY